LAGHLRSLPGYGAAHGGTHLDLLHSHEAEADRRCSVLRVEFVSTTAADATDGRTVRSSGTTLRPTQSRPDP
jgi:hypothetical protein